MENKINMFIKDKKGAYKFKNSNLRFHGMKMDINGNPCFVLSTPNQRAFSVQQPYSITIHCSMKNRKSQESGVEIVEKNIKGYPFKSEEEFESYVIDLAKSRKHVKVYDNNFSCGKGNFSAKDGERKFAWYKPNSSIKSNFENSDQSITDYVKENCSLSEISEDFLMGVDIEDIESEDDLYESGVDYIYEHSDIISYNRAMKFLQENDPSLRQAFDCAEEFGCDVKSLNSELLATLLNTRYNIDDWGKDYESIWEAMEEYRSNNDDDSNMSIHELSAQHDARKSFYGKAQVDVDDKTGVQTLYSYGTKVAQYNPKTKKFTAYPEAYTSMTTRRHVREFMKQNDVPASDFSILDDTKDVLRAGGKLAGNIVKDTLSNGGILMF